MYHIIDAANLYLRPLLITGPKKPSLLLVSLYIICPLKHGSNALSEGLLIARIQFAHTVAVAGPQIFSV